MPNASHSSYKSGAINAHAGALGAISAEEYLAQLNQRLRMHADYRPGMQFVLHRQGGFDWEPNGYLDPFTEVFGVMRRLYVVAPKRR